MFGSMWMCFERELLYNSCLFLDWWFSMLACVMTSLAPCNYCIFLALSSIIFFFVVCSCDMHQINMFSLFAVNEVWLFLPYFSASRRSSVLYLIFGIGHSSPYSLCVAKGKKSKKKCNMQILHRSAKQSFLFNTNQMKAVIYTNCFGSAFSFNKTCRPKQVCTLPKTRNILQCLRAIYLRPNRGWDEVYQCLEA